MLNMFNIFLNDILKHEPPLQANHPLQYQEY